MAFVTPKVAFPPGFRDDLPTRSEYPPPTIRTRRARPGDGFASRGVEIDEAGTVVTRFEEDEAENLLHEMHSLTERKRALEEELRALLRSPQESQGGDGTNANAAKIATLTPLKSVRRLQQVDREFRQFELQREIASLAKQEARATIEMQDARRASFCFKLRKILQHTDHRGRFVYQNGWLSITNRRVACKEADPYWGLTRTAQHGSSRVSHSSGLTVFATILLLCAVMALSARLIPTKY